ncbi:glycosyltransferase [Terrimonas pollutisoli]|uniref:glycosyltransferase n=1 Tax=Terrimonas pollutisoli TaxID=3034147 RepID=UPI0023EB0D65|nr:glycosyltransferase [Terrimonas sp. H1YJ31]
MVLHPTLHLDKIEVRGKFFYHNNHKFYVRGVTYGAFKPDSNGKEYADLEQVDRDFALMAANGINTVRIPHTTPPRTLLDLALKHRLKVMIGLSAEQYIGYVIDKKKSPNILDIIREKVKSCADHPALLCIALGNEIPARTVRWYGPKKIERYLKKVYQTVKEVAPESIVTYVNYPTTEYLQLSFLDIICFNVYLEQKEQLEKYLARLQNIAGDKPLLMGEIGLDCLRNGEYKQSEILDWQIKLAYKMGCAGLFVFSWTDEWFRGGEEVYDWAFGLTDKQRRPKPALETVKKAFSHLPLIANADWPFFSIVVCTYNGSLTIRECLEGLMRLNYPFYEVIVINDGSTDKTAEIAEEFDVMLVNTPNKGLSAARNLGALQAKGEIISYIDDDAIPDPDWLLFLAATFNQTSYAAVGGPNIAPNDVSLIADCVDHSPGAPSHVLITDVEAEHIPGCNFSIRKSVLNKLGGFDVQFTTAGDDVDMCWRVTEAGWKIGFNAGAMVWHHRRRTAKSYWKQQVGYGKAEALLERKWPQKYNNIGHKTWGRIYSNGEIKTPFFRKWRVYHGEWGQAPFQSVYGSSSSNHLAILQMPEWYLLSTALLLVTISGLFWYPMQYLWPVALIVTLLPMAHVMYNVSKITRKKGRRPLLEELRFRLITIWFHIIQPIARLLGRFKNDLTPWRNYGKGNYAIPIAQKVNVWCNNWVSPEERLEHIESTLRSENACVERGGIYCRWDLLIKGGALGSIKLFMAAEDHNEGRQFLRFRFTPRLSLTAMCLLFFVTTLLTTALAYGSAIPAIIFGVVFFLLSLRILEDYGRAYYIIKTVVKNQGHLIK